MVQAPNGEIPVGGRSVQHIWNEPQSAAIWERYASAYAQAGRSQEAGMFKRAAYLALREANRWVDDQGRPQITKNWYPPQNRHGYMGYSSYATYGLLAASMLASAWAAAEDGIPERAAPADLGGLLVQVPELSSIIAHADGAYVNDQTRGDQEFDPTGLARVQLRGVHPQFGPSCAAVDEQVVAGKTPGKSTTTKTVWGVGSIWTGADGALVRLATVRDPGLRLIKHEISANAVLFVAAAEIPGPGGPHGIEETIESGAGERSLDFGHRRNPRGQLSGLDHRWAHRDDHHCGRAPRRTPASGCRRDRCRDHLASTRSHHPDRPLHQAAQRHGRTAPAARGRRFH
jgi:hypothetical protein